MLIDQQPYRSIRYFGVSDRSAQG